MNRGIHGIFNVSKPAGMTSHDVVYAVRRITKQRKVGHAGTLDPAAVGVLPICIGQGTRIVPYLADTDKTYCAVIVLGVSTDTYDIEGRVTRRGGVVGLSQQDVERALASFVGEIEQVPPMYSSVKVKGQPLYRLARAGKEVERAPRVVQIHNLQLMEWAPPFLTIAIRCSKGTYIRSLANDLGERLGCGAYLHFLVRVQSGPFTLDDALSLPALEDAFAFDYWGDLIYPLDRVLLKLPAWIVGPDKELRIRHGLELPRLRQYAATLARPTKRRAYSLEGELVALLEYDSERDVWHPATVFSYV